MLNRQGIVGLLVTSMCGTAIAAPNLTMHVFEQEDVKPSPVVTANKTQSPTLTMHVFDGSPQLQSNAVVLPYKNRIKKEAKSPIISYKKGESYIKTGYRRDDMDFTIAGLNGTPNILSELKWRDLDIATINIGTTLFTHQNWVFNADLLYGRVFEGKNQDSDYAGNNRTQEYSRSNNSSDKGDVLDISAYVGYEFSFAAGQTNPNFFVIPKVGLSYKSQNYTMTEGYQTIPNTGNFSGLYSTYDSTWFGPWTGVELVFNASPGFTLSSNIELHYADYDSTANWNLRGDLAHPESYTNEAYGFGFVGSLDGKLKLGADLSLLMSINYQYWNADQDGEKTTYLSNGTTLKGQPFNGVRWRSFGTNLGLVYEF